MVCRDCAFRAMKAMLSGQVTAREVEAQFREYMSHHHCGKGEKWITVYLSDFSKTEGGYDLILDFFTYFDYLQFLHYRGESGDEYLASNGQTPRLSTFVFISGYKPNAPLRRGHYYLNLEVLGKRWMKDSKGRFAGEEEDTYRPPYFLASFTENRNCLSPRTALLVPAGLKAYPQWMFEDHMNPVALTTPTNSRFRLRVNNVEQGNWNEILADKDPLLMFDIGTNAFGKTITRDIQRQLKLHPIQNDIEALFVSHWHADHYNILTGMNQTELDHIKQLVCPPSVYNLSVYLILLHFALNPNTTLCVQSYPTGVKWQKTTLLNNRLNLYIRPFVKSNPNNAGLLLFFNGDNNCVILTGDAYYSIVQQVTNDGIRQMNSRGGYYMVAPHHGGKAGTVKCNIDSCVTKLEAMVSVGAGNPYGHPDPTVVNKLSLWFRSVERTDVAGTIERAL